jgi:hypothetical protein
MRYSRRCGFSATLSRSCSPPQHSLTLTRRPLQFSPRPVDGGGILGRRCEFIWLGPSGGQISAKHFSIFHRHLPMI